MTTKKKTSLCATLILALTIFYIFYQSPLIDIAKYVIFKTKPLKSAQTITSPQLSESVEIYIDQNAIAHINAQSPHDLAFGSGYVQYVLKGHNLEILRHAAKGQLSSIWGVRNFYNIKPVHHDQQALFWSFTHKAEQWRANLQNEDIRVLKLFVAGINRAQKDVFPLPLRMKALNPNPWRVTDILAIKIMDQWQKQVAWKEKVARYLRADFFPHSVYSNSKKIYNLEHANNTSSMQYHEAINSPLSITLLPMQHQLGSHKISGALRLGEPFISIGENKKLGWFSPRDVKQSVTINHTTSRPSQSGQCKITQHKKPILIWGAFKNKEELFHYKESCHGSVINDLYPDTLPDELTLYAQWTPEIDADFLQIYQELYKKDSESLSQSEPQKVDVRNKPLLFHEKINLPHLTDKTNTSYEKPVYDYSNIILRNTPHQYKQTPLYHKIHMSTQTNNFNRLSRQLYEIVFQELKAIFLQEHFPRYPQELYYNAAWIEQALFEYIKTNDGQEDLRQKIGKSFYNLYALNKRLASAQRVEAILNKTLPYTSEQGFIAPLVKKYGQQKIDKKKILDPEDLYQLELDQNNKLNIAQYPYFRMKLDLQEENSLQVINALSSVDWPFHRLKRKWHRHWINEDFISIKSDYFEARKNKKWQILLTP